jgi:hypothetical protein
MFEALRKNIDSAKTQKEKERRIKEHDGILFLRVSGILHNPRHENGKGGRPLH